MASDRDPGLGFAGDGLKSAGQTPRLFLQFYVHIT